MQASTARFEIVAGRAVGMSVLVEGELLIGRDAEGAGGLADDIEISRSHARVTVDRAGSCTIEDLGSTNGTFVNSQRISAPQALAVGDVVELGQTTLVVRELTGAEPPTPAPAPPAPAPALDATVVPQPEPPVIVDATVAGAPSVAIAEEAGAPSAPIAEEAGAPSEPPPLALHLEVDFANRELRLVMGENGEPVRVVFDGSAWRSTNDPR